MNKSFPHGQDLKPETKLVTAGRRYSEHGFVNPAVYHASTVIFPTYEAFRKREQEYIYGRRGTPTSRALETAITELEGGHLTRLMPSGLAAITTTLLSFLKAGDHLLVTDAVYLPARQFCQGMLTQLGVETEFYDPLIGERIADKMRPNTKLLYLESPGSQTMEVQDVPAMAAAAHKAGAVVAIDNTWGTGRLFPAFKRGCDISIQAATKYIVGHSDAMLGAVTVSEPLAQGLDAGWNALGLCAGPDDEYLGLRGLRTLDVRLERHMRNALIVAKWLQGVPEVEAVLYPALPDAPGHELWKRDYLGASGLFSVALKPCRPEAVSAFLDHLEHFKMGASWGGFESLALPFNPAPYRTATKWAHGGTGVRFHIGLENPDDLIADLDAGFTRLRTAA